MKDAIIETFGYGNIFTSKELLKFYRVNEDGLKESTFRWRVYALKKDGLISNIKRGSYILKQKKTFKPQISRNMKILYNMIKNKYPYIDINVWNTSWFDNFMNHQVYNSYIIIEVDRDVVESVFNMLKDKRNNVYLNPKRKVVENYILSENAIIVKPILKEMPTQDIENINVSKIEKVLVDLFMDKFLLISYQGSEMKNIFERTFEEYEINCTTLFRYARNRGIKEKIKKYIDNETNILLNYEELEK